MGIERIVLPVGLALALAGSISSLVLPSAQAQNVPEVRDKRDSAESTRTSVSQEEASRIAQEYSVSIEEVYRVDRELHQPVEETLRGLPIVKVGDFEDFKANHSFDYEHITAQNFQEFLGIYHQFVQQLSPQYLRMINQEGVLIDQKKPVISFLWTECSNAGEHESSRGVASLVRYLIQEFHPAMNFLQLRVGGSEGIYPSQVNVLKDLFPQLKMTPSLFIYSINDDGFAILREQGDGGLLTTDKAFENRQIFKVYISNQLLK